jgi:TctA family transporter
MVEQNFGRTLRFAGFDDQSFFTYLLSRPISAILLAFVVLLIFANVRSIVKSRGRETSNEG